MLTTEMIIIRIILALVAGGIIGLEREYRDKSAGFRTLILISLGSCLFTIISILLVSDTMDRIVANVVTGIGFIGGGVIFKSKEGVNGLTTAATIWVTAAVGMAVGAGFYYAAGITVLATFIVLASFYHIEKLIDRFNKEKIYTVKTSLEPGIFSTYEEVMQKNNLKFIVGKRTRLANQITATYITQGTQKDHDKFIEFMLRDENVKEFDF